MSEVPSLVGVIHLPPLPGSPRYGGELRPVIEAAARDARTLADAGFDAVIVENFGDAPFCPGVVDPVTVAAMTAAALAVRDAAPDLALGINVLRNDADAALAVAAATEARMIRINVHVGARLTDQGIIEGRAHHTLRRRRALGLSQVGLWCDVDVKHSAPLAPRPMPEEAAELTERGLADVVLLTGSGTGRPVRAQDVDAVLAATDRPVLLASGVRADDLHLARRVHGVVVGSSLRRSGRAGDPIDAQLAAALVRAYRSG